MCCIHCVYYCATLFSVTVQSRGFILPPPEVSKFSRFGTMASCSKKRRRSSTKPALLRRFTTQISRSIRISSSSQRERRRLQATWSGSAQTRREEGKKGLGEGGESDGGLKTEKMGFEAQSNAKDEQTQTLVEADLEQDPNLHTTSVQVSDTHILYKERERYSSLHHFSRY